jgi:hypothetical protein
MFCQQPPHLLRPNKRLTRIKKGGHPLVTYNNKRFKILHLPTDMFDLILFGYTNEEEGHITKADAFRKK